MVDPVDHATFRHEQRLSALERDHSEVRKAIESILIEQRRHSALLEDQREIAQKSSENLSTLLVLTERQTNMREALERAFTANAATKQAVDSLREKLVGIEREIPQRVGERLSALEREAPVMDMVKRWVMYAVLAAAGASVAMGWKSVTAQSVEKQKTTQPS